VGALRASLAARLLLNLILCRLRRRGLESFLESYSGRGYTPVAEELASRALEASRCIGCGLCSLLCPLVRAGGSAGPRALLSASRELSRAGELADVAYRCTSCGVCESVCPLSIPAYEAALLLRSSAVELEAAPPRVAELAEKTLASGRAVGVRRGRNQEADGM